MLTSKFLRWGSSFIEKDHKLLAPLSLSWRVVSWVRNCLYDRCLKKIKRVPRAVVSVGNITVGGTGKTPLVHLLAETFAHRKIAILSRGYGEIPDEALLLKRRLPKVKVYIGKDRVKEAKRAVAEGAELILLDDGFQHRRLFRDFDLVTLRGSDPFGRGHFLPRGYLRDSPKRLCRADAIFVSGKAKEKLSFPHISLKISRERFFNFREEIFPSFQKKKAAIFSGIANPTSFRETLTSLGVEIVSEWILADHEKAPIKKISSFAALSKEKGAEVLICTEKDFVKISCEEGLALPLVFLEISLSIDEGRHLWENLIAKIDQKIDNYLS